MSIASICRKSYIPKIFGDLDVNKVCEGEPTLAHVYLFVRREIK